MYSNQVRESHQSLPGNGMKEDEDRREITKGMMVLLGQMGIFIPLIIVMVSRVWLCQNWSNCKLWIMQFISYQLYINKAVKKKQLYYFHQKWITSNFMKTTVKFSQEEKLL